MPTGRAGEKMINLLLQLQEQKLLRDIDIYFARNLADTFGAPEGALLFALVFNVTEGGNTCLNMAEPEKISFYKSFNKEINNAFSENVIAGLITKGALCEAPAISAPFIKAGSSIYMKSFYSDENSVGIYIKNRVSAPYIMTPETEKLIDKYFPENNMQKAAAINTAMNSFSVISGGPGTGKTSTVFNLLAVLAEMSSEPVKIAVCAPTGKAAARLTESISEKREEYKHEAFIDQIPEKALTIHRLLGMAGDSRVPRFNKENKLPYDVVVADEASMIDVRNMAKLTEALSDDCRLILLGDKDQLASVQPGAVMGDICSAAPVDEFSTDRAEILSKYTTGTIKAGKSPYADVTIMLDKSYRYDSNAGIGLLAAAAGRGDHKTVLEVLLNDTTKKVEFLELDNNFETAAGGYVLRHFESYSREQDQNLAIEAFNKFRILTPHRQMNGGTAHINTIAQQTLFRAGHTDNTKHFYHGMPVMVVENDYSLNIFNGETGLILGNSELKSCFAHDKDKIRHITPARLPAHVPAYSMTVHKSQGSEFDHVLFILPDSDSAILTRELFYTAVTRAKTKLTVISTKDAVRKCLSAKIERSSGLFI